MTVLLAFAALYGAAAAIAVVAARRGAVSVLVVAAGVLPLPLVLPPTWHFWRFVLAMSCAVLLVRTVDLVTDPPLPRAAARFWHLVAIFDTRRVDRRRPGLDVPDLARAAAWGAVALGTLAGATALGTAPAHLVARWLLGTVMLIAAFEACTATLRLGYALAGFALPSLHDEPWRSRSLAEFWGRRWNQVVGAWLGHHCYRPLARRGHAALGVWAAFAVSALLHVYIVGASLAPRWSLPTGAFFLLQPVLLAAERAARVSSWPDPPRRAWTVLLLVLTGPLFIEPVLRMLDA